MYIAETSQSIAERPAFAQRKLERCNFIGGLLKAFDSVVKEGGMLIVVSVVSDFGFWYICTCFSKSAWKIILPSYPRGYLNES